MHASEDPEKTDRSGGGSLSDNKAAAAAYRALDFAGSAQALRLAARGLSATESKKTIALAAGISRLGDVYGRAEAAKGGDPAVAAAEYQRAVELDAQIANGMHAATLKGQATKLAKAGAQKALADQKYERAAELARIAQRAGGDDGGVMAQLKTKATELAAKAAAAQKSNPQSAAALWKTVRQMVPPTDPLAIQAQKALSAGAARDEDEE